MNLPQWLRQPAPRAVLTAGCAGYWIACLVATHLPRRAVPDVEVSDKVLHFSGYFVLATLLWLTLAAHRVRRPVRLLAVLLVLPLYGALDEVTQPLVGRSCEMGDWLSDTAATIATAATWEILAWSRRWLIS